MWYVYILKCADESLYTGSTNDLQKRLAVHNSGRGAKYTRSRLPVEVVYTEKYSTQSDALKRELALKRLTRPEKILLINQ